VANIALAVDPKIRIFPFQIIPGNFQQYSAIPRARITYQTDNETIVAKIMGNTTSIKATCNLPANFVYTFEYCTQRIEIPSDPTDAENYDDVVSLVFGFGDGFGSRSTEMLSNGITGAFANAGSAKFWTPMNPGIGPIYNQAGADGSIKLESNDRASAATAEGDYSFVLSVLQYDFEQAFAFPLNFPLPVTAR